MPHTIGPRFPFDPDHPCVLEALLSECPVEGSERTFMIIMYPDWRCAPGYAPGYALGVKALFCFILAAYFSEPLQVSAKAQPLNHSHYRSQFSGRQEYPSRSQVFQIRYSKYVVRGKSMGLHI